jgi:hypothetical protein
MCKETAYSYVQVAQDYAPAQVTTMPINQPGETKYVIMQEFLNLYTFIIKYYTTHDIDIQNISVIYIYEIYF